MPDSPPARGRAVTIFAVGFLILDGFLLLLAGLWGRRPGPAVGGVICLLGAAGAWQLWRRHRRQVAELAAARREVRHEVLALRALLRGEPPE
jgi:hypothetical protein